MTDLPAKASTSKALALLERNLVEFGEIDLSTAQNLDDETLFAAAQFSGFSEDYAEPIRLAVGVSLTARRDGAAQGEWGEWLKAFAEAVGRSVSSLNRWMKEGQVHYGLAQPKGARPRPGKDVHGAHVAEARRFVSRLTETPIPTLVESGVPALKVLQARIAEAIRVAPRNDPATKRTAKPIDTTGREVTAHFKKGKK